MLATTTTPLHPLTATAIAGGDLDGHGREDLVIDFGPAFGLWTLTNFTNWQRLHPFTSTGLALADLDGRGRDEIVVNFGSNGLWRFSQLDGWRQLNDWPIDGVLPATLH